MRNPTRRRVLGAAVAAAAVPFLRATGWKLRIGVTDWNLKLGADPDALPLAARLGFDGVQISFGRNPAGGKMPVDNPELIDRYLQLSARHKIPINGTCADILHANCLKNDKLAIGRVRDSIRLTKALHTDVLLLPFFGKCAIEGPTDRDGVADALRTLAPEAERAGVILAVENTISAEDNARILDRALSKSVQVYYDIGNSANAGFDPAKEIRWLGKTRICQIHLKENPAYLGEGRIDFREVMDAIHAIDFTGYANLETDTHPGSTVEADMKRNLAFIRKLVG
jgi:sugar phosphate isomerase/epimerase